VEFFATSEPGVATDSTGPSALDENMVPVAVIMCQDADIVPAAASRLLKTNSVVVSGTAARPGCDAPVIRVQGATALVPVTDDAARCILSRAIDMIPGASHIQAQAEVIARAERASWMLYDGLCQAHRSLLCWVVTGARVAMHEAMLEFQACDDEMDAPISRPAPALAPSADANQPGQAPEMGRDSFAGADNDADAMAASADGSDNARGAHVEDSVAQESGDAAAVRVRNQYCEPLNSYVQACQRVLQARATHQPITAADAALPFNSPAQMTEAQQQHALVLFYWSFIHADAATQPAPQSMFLRALEMYLAFGYVIVRKRTYEFHNETKKRKRVMPTSADGTVPLHPSKPVKAARALHTNSSLASASVARQPRKATKRPRATNGLN
jgi:hypothetical protein